MRPTRLTHFRHKLLNIGLGAGTGIALLLWIASYGVGWNVRFLLGSRTEIHLFRDRLLVSVASPNGDVARVRLWRGDVHFAFAKPPGNGRLIKSFCRDWRGYGCWCDTPVVTTTYRPEDGSWVTQTSAAYTPFHLRAPLCLPAAVLGVYPLWQLALWNRKIRRRRGGLCVYCGYDLRGLVEPRCPECGMAFDRARLSQQAKAGRGPTVTT